MRSLFGSQRELTGLGPAREQLLEEHHGDVSASGRVGHGGPPCLIVPTGDGRRPATRNCPTANARPQRRTAQGLAGTSGAGKQGLKGWSVPTLPSDIGVRRGPRGVHQLRPRSGRRSGWEESRALPRGLHGPMRVPGKPCAPSSRRTAAVCPGKVTTPTIRTARSYTPTDKTGCLTPAPMKTKARCSHRPGAAGGGPSVHTVPSARRPGPEDNRKSPAAAGADPAGVSRGQHTCTVWKCPAPQVPD